MNTLSNFSAFALTRGEMKSVVGGACTITFDTQDGGCSSITIKTKATQAQSVKFANSYIGKSFNGSSTVNGYNVTCR